MRQGEETAECWAQRLQDPLSPVATGSEGTPCEFGSTGLPTKAPAPARREAQTQLTGVMAGFVLARGRGTQIEK